MSKGEIIVVIDSTGNVTLSVNGIKGKGCQDLTKRLEKSLGKVDATAKTKEYYERATLQQQRAKQ